MPLPPAEYNPPPTYSKSTGNNAALKLTLPKPATFPYERSNPNNTQVVFNNQPLPSMDNSQLWNLPFDSRPQETVAEYKGGTVLKFKLG